MLKQSNIKTVTDIRQNTKQLIQEVEKSTDPIYIFQHSKPKGVFLSFKRYQEIMENLEDYFDLIEAQQVLDDQKTKFSPLDQTWEDSQLEK